MQQKRDDLIIAQPTFDSTYIHVPGDRLFINDTRNLAAGKSFSNLNRVICDETTSFITTSARPFTVRHSTSTITVAPWWPMFVTITQDVLSTSTIVPGTLFTSVYEETTETLLTIEIATSTVVDTVTTTPTYELPQSTVYAACGSDNVIGGIQGYGILNVRAKPMNRNVVADYARTPARSPQSCCEACLLESLLCYGSVWLQNTCYHLLNGEGQCLPSEEMTSFDLSLNRELQDYEGYVLSNGRCGQLVWSGNYCDELQRNCSAVESNAGESNALTTDAAESSIAESSARESNAVEETSGP